MEDDQSHPRDSLRGYRVSHPAARGRVHDKMPAEPAPPLPRQDDALRASVERIARYLKRVEHLRRDIAELQEAVENAQYGIKAVLHDVPALARRYDAFIASNAGASADEWRAFAMAYKNPGSRRFKLVVDNAPSKEQPIKRVRL